MKRLVFMLLVVAVLFPMSVAAQDEGIDKAAGGLVQLFGTAIRVKNIESFIDEYLMSDSQLQQLVDEENRNLGLSADDPGRFTLGQAKEYTAMMEERFKKAFSAAVEAMKIMSGINAAGMEIKDFSAQKSYWDPPVAEITVSATGGGKEVVIRISNLSLVDGELRLGPSSRLEFQGYQTPDLIGYYIVEALRRRDSGYYADNVLPDAAGLKALLEANEGSGGFNPDASAEELYRMIRERVTADFDNLLTKGSAEGIEWGSIDNVWTGYSASLEGNIYSSSIPVEFSSGGKAYRLVLDYCSQLASDPSIFLPGEFVW